MLAGSLARPTSVPQPPAAEGGEGGEYASPVYEPETRVAFYKKVGGNLDGRIQPKLLNTSLLLGT